MELGTAMVNYSSKNHNIIVFIEQREGKER